MKVWNVIKSLASLLLAANRLFLFLFCIWQCYNVFFVFGISSKCLCVFLRNQVKCNQTNCYFSHFRLLFAQYFCFVFFFCSSFCLSFSFISFLEIHKMRINEHRVCSTTTDVIGQKIVLYFRCIWVMYMLLCNKHLCSFTILSLAFQHPFHIYIHIFIYSYAI